VRPVPRGPYESFRRRTSPRGAVRYDLTTPLPEA
jgi:hypothetical protein